MAVHPYALGQPGSGLHLPSRRCALLPQHRLHRLLRPPGPTTSTSQRWSRTWRLPPSACHHRDRLVCWHPGSALEFRLQRRPGPVRRLRDGSHLLRPTVVWGAGLDRSLSRIATLACRWGLFVLPRGARGKRQPVHVFDLAAAAVAVADCPLSHGQAYALGGGQVISDAQMVRQVLQALPGRPRLWLVADSVFRLLVYVAGVSGKLQGFGPAMQPRMGQDLVFDIGPAQRDFGYAPRGFAPNAAELGMDQ